MVQHYTNQSTDGIQTAQNQPTTRPSAPAPSIKKTNIVNRDLPDTMTWEAFEHEHREHSPDWFWIVWIVALAVSIASLIFSNFLFGAIVIVSAFLMTTLAHHKPRISTYTLSHRGVAIDQTLYPFSSLDGFAIKDNEEEHDGRFLLLKSKHSLVPIVIIPIADEIEVRDLRDYLLEELRERDLHLPFSERIMELIGF